MNKQSVYMDAAECDFYRMESGFMGLRYKSQDLGRVTAVRVLPFQYEEKYLSVRQQNYKNGEIHEIGIIRDLAEFPSFMKKIIREDLERRYFMPKVTEVEDVKDEYGHTLWKVKTDCGKREFAVHDMGVNLKHLGSNKVILTDLSGNRYFFDDITKMGEKTMKVVEIWL